MKGLQTSCFFLQELRSAWHFHAISAGLPRYTIFSKFRNAPKPLQKISRPQLTWRDGQKWCVALAELPLLPLRMPGMLDGRWDARDLGPSNEREKGTTLPKFAKYYRGGHPNPVIFSRLFECCLKNVLNEEFDVCDVIDLTSKLG